MKPGVDLRGIQPQMAIAALIAERLYAAHGAELMITSGVEGQHMVGSLHYKGLAIDLRLPDWPANNPITASTVVSGLRSSLGAQFDVVLEKDHIHVEFDVHEKSGG